jgi:hypothetical protein
LQEIIFASELHGHYREGKKMVHQKLQSLFRRINVGHYLGGVKRGVKAKKRMKSKKRGRKGS